ncbi:MAG: PAS domain S-box protein, partial [Deltaproteobacteria bacterium]
LAASVSYGAWLAALHPEDLHAAEERIGHALKERTTLQSDYRVVGPGGRIRWISATGRGCYDKEGVPIRMVGTCIDISDRKQAEEALRASSETLLLLLESAAEAVYGLDMEGMCTFSNKSCLRMLGYERPEHLVGRNMHELIHAKHDDGTHYAVAECPIFRAFTSREEVHVESEVLWRKDGTSFFAEYWSHPILRDGRVIGAVVSFMDITDRRRAEQERIKLEELLHQSQKMESIGHLAGGVAHDFNNMLGVILGHSEIALEQVGPATLLHDDLSEIRNAARRSADLTRQLLTFARRQTVSPRVVDLNDAVAGTLKMLQRLIGENVRLSLSPGAGLWLVKVDPSQIDQLLANLCVNARDAIADVGRVTIETANGRLDEDYCAPRAGVVPGEYVQIVVSDDGCGMDKETLAHIFEPFFTTKGVSKGTGLGLATVYGIVKQNHGSIDVHSEPGRGTAFTIYLPRITGHATPLPAMAPTLPDPHRHETILLVEDEPSLLKAAARMLERQGYTVLAAGLPGDAMRMATECAAEIHLLLTDVIMPEMNGRDLSRNIIACRPGIKRLFMSGFTADVIAHDGLLDEGVHFLQKPFTRVELAAKVREALDQG